MRKLIFALIALIGLSLPAHAQQDAKKPVAPKKEVKTAKKEVKAATVKATAPKPPLRKNGTPDLRYQANKAPKVPLKKDGTPDKRYKENKK